MILIQKDVVQDDFSNTELVSTGILNAGNVMKSLAELKLNVPS